MHVCACMLAGPKRLDLSPEQEEALIAESASHKKAKGVDAAAIRSAVCLCLGCLKLLTTGPDRPIMPLGPGGPLIASCGAEKAELSTLTAFFFFFFPREKLRVITSNQQKSQQQKSCRIATKMFVKL